MECFKSNFALHRLHRTHCYTIVPLDSQDCVVKETWRSDEARAPRLDQVEALCPALWAALVGFRASAERRAAAGGGQREDAAGGYQRPTGSGWAGWEAPECSSGLDRTSGRSPHMKAMNGFCPSLGVEWGNGPGAGLPPAPEGAAGEDSSSHGGEAELHAQQVRLQRLCPKW